MVGRVYGLETASYRVSQAAARRPPAEKPRRPTRFGISPPKPPTAANQAHRALDILQRRVIARRPAIHRQAIVEDETGDPLARQTPRAARALLVHRQSLHSGCRAG